jgi:catechol 2,3-dioxygenase-like lactoylglutathione lyase family enzyme
MTGSPTLTLAGMVLDAPDPRQLAGFYQRLLGWEIAQEEPTLVQLRGPAPGRPSLAFQLEPEFVRPVWPSNAADQQMMAHLDIAVDDLEAAGAHAVSAGAVLAAHQPQDDVRVYLDPAGHPFCLFRA